jgi:hypothetical protein
MSYKKQINIHRNPGTLNIDQLSSYENCIFHPKTHNRITGGINRNV